MAVLNELRQSALESEFVFPASGARGHLVEIKKIWKALCQNAGIGDCRIHDLRHSFASIVASDGGSLQTVGALLGHTQAQTTQRYAHLFDDTLREAAERLSLRLEGRA
jgi:integrase